MSESPLASNDPSPALSPETSATTPVAKADAWKAVIAAAVTYRDDFLEDWRDNVNFRAMKPFGGSPAGDDTTADRVALAEDWSRTKQKQAQLNFQIVKIVANPTRPEDKVFAPVVTAAVNQTLRQDCRAHFALDECLADGINAAGIFALKVGVEKIIQEVEIDDPAYVPQPVADGVPAPPAPKVKALRPVAHRFHTDRISPASLLWPAEFAGSDWDKCTWLGEERLVPLEIVKRHEVWGPKVRAQGDKIQTVEGLPETLAKELQTGARGKVSTVKCLKVRQIYYRAAAHDPDALHPDELRTVVYIEGIDGPVEGPVGMTEQEWVPPTPERPGYFKGLTCLPIRVGTLTYISDLAVPPSDSRAGRSQVLELMRSRAQMLKQRDTSIPIRWYDTNRLDEDIVTSIRNGTWQDLIPVNGPGDRVIGEVARANYPRENFQFQGILGRDLDGAWSLSNNQLAAPNATERSATEVNAVQGASQVRLDYEKARVHRFVADAAAVLWSLMARYKTGPEFVEIVGEEGAKTLAPLAEAAFGGSYTFDFVPDSGDRVDIQTQQANFTKVYNILRKSPNAIGLAMDEELIRLHGYDPARFIKEAPPPAPEPPNFSFRFAAEDLLNPMVAAVALKAYNLTPEDIANAALLIKDAMIKATQAPPAHLVEGGLSGEVAQAPGAAPSPGLAPSQLDQKPAESVEPITKRANDGTHLT